MNIGGIGCSSFVTRNANVKAKSQSSVTKNTDNANKFDIMAFTTSRKKVESELPSSGTLADAMLNNASQEVKDAWAKAEKESGFNPFTDDDGKIVGSSLLAKYMEMEYNLMLRFGDKEARARMENLFSDTNAAKSLVQASLVRANNPLVPGKDPAQLAKEKRFFELFLSYLD